LPRLVIQNGEVVLLKSADGWTGSREHDYVEPDITRIRRKYEICWPMSGSWKMTMIATTAKRRTIVGWRTRTLCMDYILGGREISFQLLAPGKRDYPFVPKRS
jgi:hypothetical protein